MPRVVKVPVASFDPFARHLTIVASEVLSFARAFEAAARKCFEPHEQTSQTRGGRVLNQVIAQDRIHCRRSLKDAAHAFHPAKQLARKPDIAEKMIVQKIKMPARQSGNLSERVVDHLGVEASPAGEERVLVTERAMVRAA